MNILTKSALAAGLALAALTAPAPLWIHRAGEAFDKAWAESSYALAGSGHTLWIDAEAAKPAEIARWIDSGDR